MAPTKRKQGNIKSKTQPTAKVGDYIAGAEAQMAESEHPLARKILIAGLKAFPNNAEMRLLLGVVEMELGNVPSARQVLETLIPPSPTAPSPPSLDAYFYLAQIHESPREALTLYQAGIDLVVKALKGKGPAVGGPDVSDDDLKKKAVKAITAMVGIWMTDLCFEPEAEQECETLLAHAQDLDQDNPEVLRTLASVRVSQQRNDEAKVLAERSWAAWKDLEPNDLNAPSVDDRLALAQLFLELKVYPSSFSVVQSVLAENDQEVEGWYLQGLGYWEMSLAMEAGTQVDGVDEMTWQETMQVARDCLGTCRELFETQDYPDTELRQQIVVLISEMEKKGFQQTVDPDPETEEWKGMQGDEDGDVDVENDDDSDGNWVDEAQVSDVEMS